MYKQPYVYVTASHQLEELVRLIGEQSLISLDTESYPLAQWGKQASALDCHTSRIRLIQINWAGSPHAYLVDCVQVDAGPLVNALMRDSLTKVAHTAQHELRQFRASYGVWLPSVRCSMTLMKTLSVVTGWKTAQFRTHKLEALARDFGDVILDKEEQCSDWSSPTLTREQLQYAANDVGGYLLEAYQLIETALRDQYGCGRALLVDQGVILPLARIEYVGMYVNRDILGVLQERASQLTAESQRELCETLGLPLERELVLSDSGLLEHSIVIPDKVAKLLNYSVGLLKYVNKKLKPYSVQVDSLDVDELRELCEELDEVPPVLKALMTYKKYAKLLGDIEKHGAAINVVTGRLHTNFNAIGAGTSRMSSSGLGDIKLNLQQVNKFRLQVDVAGEKRVLSLRDAFTHTEGTSIAVCLEGGTLVTMGDGSLKPIRDVVIGDTVLTDGGPGKVSFTKRTENRKVVRLISEKGYEIKGTPGHRVLTISEGGERLYKEIRQLEEGDWLVLHGGSLGTSVIEELKGYFERGHLGFASATPEVNRLELVSLDESFIKRVQVLLLMIGIPSRIVPRQTHYRDHGFMRVNLLMVSGRANLLRLEQIVGWRDNSLRELIEGLPIQSRDHASAVPYALFERGFSPPKGTWPIYKNLVGVAKHRGYIRVGSLRLLEERLPGCLSGDPTMRAVLDCELFFDQVKEVVKGCSLIGEPTYLGGKATRDPYEICDVYDITVKGKGRFTANGLVVHNCDYSAQELRVAAALSRDKAMLEAFITERDNPNLTRQGDDGQPIEYKNPLCDLHTVASLALFPHLGNVPLWELSQEVRKPSPTGDTYRDIGKVFSFSVIYGAVAKSLAVDLKCSVLEATKFLDAYFGRFSGLKRWLTNSAKLGRQHKWLENGIGRKLFVYEANNKGDENSVERKGPNALIQSLSADMMKIALSKIDERMQALNRETGLTGELIAVVHDEVVALVPGAPIPDGYDKDGKPKYKFSDISKRYAALLRDCMEEAERELLSPLVGFDFPCKAEPALGLSWAVK